MLAALTPSSAVSTSKSTISAMPIHQSTSLTTSNNNNSVSARTTNAPVHVRSNGSTFGWGNRERKMEENWRMQNRNI